MTAPPDSSVPPRLLLWPALLVALGTLAGSLWLSIGMQLKACPLCFYQRTLVMGVTAVLGIGMLCGRQHRVVLPVLALPIAGAALAIAGFHVYLELSGSLECPAGILGIGTSPQQSAVALCVLFLLVAVGAWRARGAEGSRLPWVAGIALGGLLAWAAVASAPPPPARPTAPYPAPPEICRPPHRQ